MSQTSKNYYTKGFKNSLGLNLHCHYWKPESKPRAILLIAHGFSEHSFVYEDIAVKMMEKGFFVFAHDAAGHGRSEGVPACINNLDDLVRDAVTHIQIVRKDYPDLPLFMFGHSMGGALSILTSLQQDVQMRGMVLIAPMLASTPELITPFKLAALWVLNKLLPNYGMFPTVYSLACRNEEKLKEMEADSLRFHGRVSVRTAASLLAGVEEIHSKVKSVKVPFLLFHGDGDKVCHVDGSTEFYEKAASTDKTLKVYPGSYHSLMYEPDGIWDEIMSQSISWFCERL